MEPEVLFNISYIKLTHTKSGEYCLSVEDTALNDYVEEFIWDDFKYQSTTVSIEDRSKPPIYFNYFDADFPVDGLIEMLKQLDVNEVERIYRLNN